MVCVEMKRGCTTYDTGVNLQFPTLRDAGRYVALIQRGPCLRPVTVIAKMLLFYDANRPGDGMLGYRTLNLGIHHFLKDGYSIALQDRDGKNVACGDIRSDRFY